MATCDISTLLSQACANHFTCLDRDLFRAVELQLLAEISGSDDDFAALFAQACVSGFACAGDMTTDQYRRIELQLLCNISGGT